LLRDDAAFASGKGGFGLIDCQENFRAGALTFFSQGKGFLHRRQLIEEQSKLQAVQRPND
jgi:hypothetical protein